jgi:alanine dehydrogenase
MTFEYYLYYLAVMSKKSPIFVAGKSIINIINMIVGILKEIKINENRVSMTPSGVDMMVHHGHTVLVEKGAGIGSGFSDIEYETAGGKIINTPEEIFAQAEMVMHVKEIIASEYHLLRPGQIVFAYLHLAADLQQIKVLMESKCVAIAYETVELSNGSLPLLQPMSEVAGRMSIQASARFLEMSQGGRGVLLGGVPGVAPAKVVILGGGVVGTNAAKMACGLGADVTILDKNLERLRNLSDIMPANCKLLMSNPMTVREEIKSADVVVGALLVAGGKTPQLVTREMVSTMKKGAVIVDVAIDQGGCFETSHATTHKDPVYVVDDVIHYCISNMPGAVARTSTFALTNATLPYALAIADKGWKKAMADDPALSKGLNVCDGKIVYAPVAEAFDLEYDPMDF